MTELAGAAFLIQLLASTLRLSTPLVFASLGGWASERAGVINIALEGMMLGGAFAGAAATLAFHSPWLGLGAAMAAGALIAAIYAFFVVNLRANQIVAGTAINFLAAGVTPLLCKLLYDSTASSATVPIEDRFKWAPLVLAGGAVILAHLWSRRTVGGLWHRFAGEHPEALSAAGVSVNRVRTWGVIASGALAGLGGACLSIFLSSSFSRNMTAGRGFMAIAALIFGAWRPGMAALACLLFGFTDALQIRLQGVVLWGTEPVPVQFIQILPYVVTILVLAGLVGDSRAPKALGTPFKRR